MTYKVKHHNGQIEDGKLYCGGKAYTLNDYKDIRFVTYLKFKTINREVDENGWYTMATLEILNNDLEGKHIRYKVYKNEYSNTLKLTLKTPDEVGRTRSVLYALLVMDKDSDYYEMPWVMTGRPFSFKTTKL
jgi:hypothetical protein